MRAGCLSLICTRFLAGIGPLLLLLALPCGATFADESLPAPSVRVVRDGDRLTIDARFHADAPLAIAWNVLTDFAGMHKYVPNLSSSEAFPEGPELLRVRQTGTVRWGPFGFDFESVRRIRLHPMTRIESTTLSGKISKMRSTSELIPGDRGVEIRYHANAEIDFWMPPGIGISVMQRELEEQFNAMAAEMRRRQLAASS